MEKQVSTEFKFLSSAAQCILFLCYLLTQVDKIISITHLHNLEPLSSARKGFYSTKEHLNTKHEVKNGFQGYDRMCHSFSAVRFLALFEHFFPSTHDYSIKVSSNSDLPFHTSRLSLKV